MEEKNPLQIHKTTVVGRNSTLNMRGRPIMEKAIIFGPQPKSIVSQFLLNSADNEVQDIEIIETSEHEVSKRVKKKRRNKHIQDISTNENFCKICSLKCKDITELKKHLATHKQFFCDFPECNYSCKLSSNLKKHKRVHSDEKPYLCDRCSFRSNFINSLKAHKRIHTSEKPFRCKHCSYQCNSSSNLKKHCLHRHKETSNKDVS